MEGYRVLLVTEIIKNGDFFLMNDGRLTQETMDIGKRVSDQDFGRYWRKKPNVYQTVVESGNSKHLFMVETKIGEGASREALVDDPGLMGSGWERVNANIDLDEVIIVYRKKR